MAYASTLLHPLHKRHDLIATTHWETSFLMYLIGMNLTRLLISRRPYLPSTRLYYYSQHHSRAVVGRVTKRQITGDTGVISCGCRCIECKGQQLKSYHFVGQDGYDDIHHTCKLCGTHFNHLDGETYSKCEICKFP